ncbi:MAG: UDP-2,3-diacylglucosamine diphosphatase, partial [Chitinophagales bacterium]
MKDNKKIYFASDIHLGTPTYADSREREAHFVAWLDAIFPTCEELFLVGDIFDFWFDYKTVVPKGYVRLFGKLAEFADAGIPIHFFYGNHDMWQRDYFEKELGAKIHSDNIEFERNGKYFFVGHGDGKGPNDKKYKFLKKIFRNPICKWLFGWIHPDIGLRIANFWSRSSRYGKGEAKKEVFENADKEWLVSYVKRKMQTSSADYYIFGHRHLALDLKIEDKVRYINLGDWLHYNSYAVFDGQNIELKYFQKDNPS